MHLETDTNLSYNLNSSFRFEQVWSGVLEFEGHPQGTRLVVLPTRASAFERFHKRSHSSWYPTTVPILYVSHHLSIQTVYPTQFFWSPHCNNKNPESFHQCTSPNSHVYLLRAGCLEVQRNLMLSSSIVAQRDQSWWCLLYLQYLYHYAHDLKTFAVLTISKHKEVQ